MSVSPREVFGPARANTLKDWWQPTQVGRPLTPRMAYYLRRSMWSSTPGVVKRALAERGLLNDTRAIGDNLTELGNRLRSLLGRVPTGLWPKSSKPHQVAPSEEWVTCPACGANVSAELIAWGASSDHQVCIKCTLEEA